MGERRGGDGSVAVFAPAPLLTITIEAVGEGAEVHLHPGGQGYWVARMVSALGVETCLCGSFGGEVGGVVQTLIAAQGVRVRGVPATGGNGAYLHDRRSGKRQVVVEVPADPLVRHDVDALYGVALVEGLTASVAVLGGPDQPGDVPADTYRRLASDLRDGGTTVIADLSGEPLAAALAGGVDVVKVSDEELVRDGRVGLATESAVVAVITELAAEGAGHVVVTRRGDPLVALLDGDLVRVVPPHVQPVDTRGAGDSLTAGVAAGLARGLDLVGAVRLGVAAGALNVTRHGLGSGQRDVIERLADHVVVEAGAG